MIGEMRAQPLEHAILPVRAKLRWPPTQVVGKMVSEHLAGKKGCRLPVADEQAVPANSYPTRRGSCPPGCGRTTAVQRSVGKSVSTESIPPTTGIKTVGSFAVRLRCSGTEVPALSMYEKHDRGGRVECFDVGGSGLRSWAFRPRSHRRRPCSPFGRYDHARRRLRTHANRASSWVLPPE